MANTLTNLMPYAFEALDIVSDEMVGFTKVASRNGELDSAAMNEEIKIPITAEATPTDIAPSMTVPIGEDRAPGQKILKITKSRAVGFHYDGEETKQVDRTGMYPSIQGQNIAQAMRTLMKEIEVDLGQTFFGNAGRCLGTKGTMPFAKTHGEISDMVEILNKAGAPQGDRVLVLGSSECNRLRQISNLLLVDQSGSTDVLRRGILGNIHNFNLYESALDIKNSAAAAASYVIDGNQSAGDTTITVKTGTAKIAKGSVIKIQDYPDQHMVLEDQTGAGDVVIALPGLTEDVGNGKTVTVINGVTITAGFNRSALYLGMRPPARPKEGDMAADVVTVNHPGSGLVFEMAYYKGYHMTHYEVGAAWGVGQIKPEHATVLYH